MDKIGLLISEKSKRHRELRIDSHYPGCLQLRRYFIRSLIGFERELARIKVLDWNSILHIKTQVFFLLRRTTQFFPPNYR